MERKVSVKSWLAEKGFKDVLEMIEAQETAWAEQGKKTRRNWWDVLAGGKNGKARNIGGIEFPVLAAAQERMNRAVTANALNEPLPAPEVEAAREAPEPPAKIVEAAMEVEPEPVLEAAPEILPESEPKAPSVIIERR